MNLAFGKGTSMHCWWRKGSYPCVCSWEGTESDKDCDVIGDESFRRMRMRKNLAGSSGTTARRKPFGEIHLKVY